MLTRKIVFFPRLINFFSFLSTNWIEVWNLNLQSIWKQIRSSVGCCFSTDLVCSRTMTACLWDMQFNTKLLRYWMNMGVLSSCYVAEWCQRMTNLQKLFQCFPGHSLRLISGTVDRDGLKLNQHFLTGKTPLLIESLKSCWQVMILSHLQGVWLREWGWCVVVGC